MPVIAPATSESGTTVSIAECLITAVSISLWGLPMAVGTWKWNLLRNDKNLSHDGRYLTDTLNDEAIQWIQQSSNQPFALFAHHAPHSPLAAPQQLVDKYRKLGEDKRSGRRDLRHDRSHGSRTGRVFSAIKEIDLWDNTVIVFTSDNGPWHGRD